MASGAAPQRKPVLLRVAALQAPQFQRQESVARRECRAAVRLQPPVARRLYMVHQRVAGDREPFQAWALPLPKAGMQPVQWRHQLPKPWDAPRWFNPADQREQEQLALERPFQATKLSAQR
jgi:hypothetical protein